MCSLPKQSSTRPPLNEDQDDKVEETHSHDDSSLSLMAFMCGKQSVDRRQCKTAW